MEQELAHVRERSGSVAASAAADAARACGWTSVSGKWRNAKRTPGSDCLSTRSISRKAWREHGHSYSPYSTITVGAGIAQSLTGKVGVRLVFPSGFALATVGLSCWRAPVDGDHRTDLFPAFVIFGLGMSFAFVGQQIGAQLGVGPADAGIALGLINTSQQVGGAVAVAIGTTIAATATQSYAESNPGTSALSGAALTHGYEVAYSSGSLNIAAPRRRRTARVLPSLR